jgi:two-component system, chemotaxis family, chemotaxis protein CheY
VKTVMLVDDSRTVLLSMSALLTAAGYQSIQAATGEAGVAQALRTVVDVVITDLNMPGIDGIQVIRELRKIPGYKYTPILVMTTESDAERRAEARAAGATGWLVKPVPGADLVKVLAKVAAN